MVSIATPIARSPHAQARWLVVAPHADDETIGTGALIAQAARARRLAGIVFLTDGSGSHACDTRADRTALVRRRRHEAVRALSRLTAHANVQPAFLDWRDAHPYPPHTVGFARSVRRIAAMLRHGRIDAIATTAAGEPHCDHAACFTLAVHAARAARRSVSIFEYAVWGERPAATRVLRTRSMPPASRMAALRAHRSQLTGLMGEGFRLPRAQQRMPATDLLYLVRPDATRP